MDRKILQHKQKIDNLFKEVASISDMRMQGEWAKYLCVLCSGYLENSIRIITTEFVAKNSSPKIQRYHEPSISNLTNFKVAKIQKFLEQFDLSWGTVFTHQIDTKSTIKDEIKDSIDSLVQNRHDIAHGKSIGIGYTTVKKYYEKAQIAIEIIDTIVT